MADRNKLPAEVQGDCTPAIGYQWTIYHRRSDYNANGILACGITDDPVKAQSLVEMLLTEVDHAAWGLLLRVVLDHAHPSRTVETFDWPPAGKFQVCRRDLEGGFQWGPLFPD